MPGVMIAEVHIQDLRLPLKESSEMQEGLGVYCRPLCWNPKPCTRNPKPLAPDPQSESTL